MADDIQACKDLIAYELQMEFSAADSTTIIRTNPQPILAGCKVALYAQSTSGGDRTIFMRSPSLKRELERLAEQGVGITIERNRVKWMFVKVDISRSGTTTPISNLS